MFEKGSKPFQEILSTAEHAASRAAHSAKGICQAKLQAHVIPCRRHSSKRSLLCLIPASAAFHTVQKHAVLLVIWLQATASRICSSAFTLFPIPMFAMEER